MADNPVNNKRTKHIDIRYHHVRDWVEKKTIELVKVPTADNMADIFTKALPKPKFEDFTNKLLI